MVNQGGSASQPAPTFVFKASNQLFSSLFLILKGQPRTTRHPREALNLEDRDQNKSTKIKTKHNCGKQTLHTEKDTTNAMLLKKKKRQRAKKQLLEIKIMLVEIHKSTEGVYPKKNRK